MRRVRVTVEGRVQGVCFRASTRERAQALGVTGWVRNLSDGRVEAQAQGEDAAVEALLAFCRQGPPRAAVARVVVEELPARPDERGFAVR